MDVGSPTLGNAAIPGDPEGLRAIVTRLQAARDDVTTVQGRVASNGLGDWTGSAADAFRSSLRTFPGELGLVTGAFDGAANAISTFSSQLAALQERAAYYASRILALEQELAAAQRRHAEAQSNVESARLRESLAHDPVSLKTAVDAVRYGLSLLHQAVDDVDTNSQAIRRVRQEADTNREHYEDAVRACCAQLQDAADSYRHSNGSSHVAVSGMIGGLALLWTRYLRRPAGLISGAEGTFGTIDDLTEKILPVSSLGKWAVPIVRVANNPMFKGVGYVFTGVAVAGDVLGMRTTWNETAGENIVGRVYTEEIIGVGDVVLLRFPPAAVANAITGGALSADVNAAGLIAGGGVSGGMSGAERAYDQDVRDRESGNYLGLGEHVVGGAVSGAAKGALAGDDQFANNATSGQYGGFVKDFAKGEDYLIEHPKAALSAVAHAPVHAAKDLYHGADDLLHDL